MRLIDQQYLLTPFFGSRRMVVQLAKQKHIVNRKRVQRLMRTMGIEGLAPGRKTSVPCPEHRIFPYLLRGLTITGPDHVWSTDITYIPMQRGFLYLVAVIDWFSRYVLSWGLSNTLETGFCLDALDAALAKGRPQIFNTDQGAQFTSRAFVQRLQDAEVAVSMDGRGRALDNVFIERFWRSLKYEEVYLREYTDGWNAAASLGRYFSFYCEERPHQALAYRTPGDVYRGV